MAWDFSAGRGNSRLRTQLTSFQTDMEEICKTILLFSLIFFFVWESSSFSSHLCYHVMDLLSFLLLFFYMYLDLLQLLDNLNLFHHVPTLSIVFFFFWLRWVFVAVCRLSLVAASRGYSSLRCAGFSLQWLLLLWSTGSRRAGFSICGTRAQ